MTHLEIKEPVDWLKKMKATLKGFANSGILLKEAPISLKLPYSIHFDGSTIKTRDNQLIKTIKLGGFSFETADFDVLTHLMKVFNGLVLNLCRENISLTTHLINRRISPTVDGEFTIPFAANLNRDWQNKFKETPMFTTELYLSIICYPHPIYGAEKKVGVLKSLYNKLFSTINVDGLNNHLDKNSKQLDEIVAQFCTSLKGYSPKILSLYETVDGLYSDPLRFYNYLLNLEDHPIVAPTSDLSEFIPTKQYSFGSGGIQISGNVEKENKFGQMLMVRSYSDKVRAGILDDIMTVPHEFIMTQSFSPLAVDVGVKKLKLHQSQMIISESDARKLINEIDEAVDSMASGELVYGKHHCSVFCFGNSLDQADDCILAISSILRDKGFSAVKEGTGKEVAFFSQFPGNRKYTIRSGSISSINFACLASNHNYPTGHINGAHWGPALCQLETTSGSPYMYSNFVDDLGNTLVFGPTGSGKTVFCSFMLAMSLKYGGRRFIFDKGHANEIFVRACDGIYTELKLGRKTGFNPFQLPDDLKAGEKSSPNREFLGFLLRLIIKNTLVRELTAEEINHISNVVKTSYTLPKEHRRLFHLRRLFPQGENSMRSAIENWCGEGPYAWIFDNDEDIVDFSNPMIGFEMGEILPRSDILIPIAAYLFHLMDQALDGTRTVIFIDEFHLFLKDPLFGPKVEEWYRVVRKKNAHVICATQTPNEIYGCQEGKAIVKQTATFLHYSDYNAEYDMYVNNLHLSVKQFESIRSTPKELRHFVLVNGNDTIIAKLDMKGVEDYLHVISGRDQTVALMRELRKKYGEHSSLWLPQFIKKAKELTLKRSS